MGAKRYDEVVKALRAETDEVLAMEIVAFLDTLVARGIKVRAVNLALGLASEVFAINHLGEK